MKIRSGLAFLLAVCLLVPLAACGGKDQVDQTPLLGIYGIVDITDDPDGAAFAEVEAVYKEIGRSAEDYFYLEFLEDKRFTLVVFGEEEAAGAYTRKDGELTFSYDGKTTAAAISGQTITWPYETGAKLVFEKK